LNYEAARNLLQRHCDRWSNEYRASIILNALPREALFSVMLSVGSDDAWN